MIRFSRREDYAVILINSLTKAYKKRLVPLSEVAKEYTISLLFLRNLAGDLRDAGIIKAVEGKQGGYYLTRDPKAIQIGEVLRVFSPEEQFTCCSTGKKEDHQRTCPKKEDCVAGNIWRQLNKEFIDTIYRLSLPEFFAYTNKRKKKRITHT